MMSAQLTSEILKYRFNRGRQLNRFLYRDSTCSEVDVLYEIGRAVFPIEIKAGSTVNEDFFGGLRSFVKVMKKVPYGSGLIYGGSKAEVRTECQVVPVGWIQILLEDVGASARGEG